MSDHTPGPWTVVREDRKHLDPSWYVTAQDPDHPTYKEVAFHIGLAGGNSQTLNSGRMEANARLVAAAPELLDALAALLLDLGGYAHHPDQCSRIEECDERGDDECCAIHDDDEEPVRTDNCPSCECGWSRTRVLVAKARAAVEKAVKP